MTAALTTRRLRSMAALREIEASWWALAGRVSPPNFYATPAFLMPWAESVATTWAPDAVAVHRGDELVGFLPLFRRRLGRWKVGYDILGFPVQGSTPAFDLLAAAGTAGDVARAVVDRLARSRDWDTLWLHSIDPSAEANAAFLEQAAARLHRLPAATTEVLGVDTGRDTFAAYVEQRDGHQWRELRRVTRRLRERGAVRLRLYPRDDDLSLEEALDAALAVTCRSWKASNAADAEMAALRKLAIAADRSRCLRVRLLEIDGVAISQMLEFVFRGRVHLFNLANDTAFRSFAPGLQLFVDTIEQGFAEGATEIDFASRHRYLEKLASTRRPEIELRATRRNLWARGRATAYFHIRDRRHRAAKEALEDQKAAAKRAGAAG